MTPWDVFCSAVATDPASPRVTFYERTPGPTSGERIELSGKVLLNWASKAANLLAEEFDVEPGARVGIDLPAAHWRSVYWMLAAWANGASVVFTDTDRSAGAHPSAEVDVRVGTTGDVDVLVTLAALARGAGVDVPDGVLDEARDLPTFADQFTPLMPADPRAEALPGTSVSELAALAPAPRLHRPSPTPEEIFTGVIGGGIVLLRGPVTTDDLAAVLRQENLDA